MVYVDIHLYTYWPVSALLEAVHNRLQFFIVDWPVVLCGGDSLCMGPDYIDLFAYVDDMVLRKDTSNCLIATIGFHNCLEGSIELDEDGS